MFRSPSRRGPFTTNRQYAMAPPTAARTRVPPSVPLAPDLAALSWAAVRPVISEGPRYRPGEPPRSAAATAERRRAAHTVCSRRMRAGDLRPAGAPRLCRRAESPRRAAAQTGPSAGTRGPPCDGTGPKSPDTPPRGPTGSLDPGACPVAADIVNFSSPVHDRRRTTGSVAPPSSRNERSGPRLPGRGPFTLLTPMARSISRPRLASPAHPTARPAPGERPCGR